jgi:CheY-like chemotaxis protein
VQKPLLVVDDDANIRSLASEILTAADYDVETAANGVEALAAIERRPPAAMLLDLRMPVLDGWGVAHSLHSRHQRVPTVVMTAAEYAPAWCADVRADACLGKPFGPDELLAAVARALGQ